MSGPFIELSGGKRGGTTGGELTRHDDLEALVFWADEVFGGHLDFVEVDKCGS